MVGVNVNKSDDEGLDCNSKEPPETTRRPRRRKSTRQHQQEEDDDGEINVAQTQKKRKVREPAPPKKRKKLEEIIQTSVDQIEDDNNPNGDEEEEEGEEQLTLTVEDLLSIAKEYVQADRERVEVQSSSNRDLESEKKLLASTSVENGDILNQKLSTDSAMGSTSRSEQSLVSISRTGDPAQDMLDLFLGPLLKKPVEDQNSTKFTTNDIEFRKLSQTQKTDAGQEHTVAAPVMKKKSSLKDKVAMLLD